ncbi:MAG TPA: hypothetical protein VF559_01910 [Caulobacteraceae bacterium]|jgi:hypothetical protein
MNIDRRALLAGAGLSATAVAAPALGQAPAPPSESAGQKKAAAIAGRLNAAAAENRRRLAFDGRGFSGPGYDFLVEEGRRAHFFLQGEEHGVAENAHLARALIQALAPAGYSRLAIEISPPMAEEVDEAVKGGSAGLKRYFDSRDTSVPFYGLREEAEFLAAARRALPGDEPVFWGLDYDIGADRRLIARLKAKRPPAAAEAAFAKLEAASSGAWAEFRKTKNPQFIFSFSGDPQLVRDVRAAWTRPDPEAELILETLQTTLEINQLWAGNQPWESNKRRVDFMRANFLRNWRREKGKGRSPKVFFKFGTSHMVRGLSLVDVFDVGTLAAESAALAGGHSFHLLVVGGAGGQHAAFNPAEWAYDPQPAEGIEEHGLEPIARQAFGEGFTVIDLRPLRPILSRPPAEVSRYLVKVVHGFDAVVLLTGSTASGGL